MYPAKGEKTTKRKENRKEAKTFIKILLSLLPSSGGSILTILRLVLGKRIRQRWPRIKKGI